MPSIDRQTIETILPIIGSGLKIPYQYLHPADSFDSDLNIKDRFWCLVADDCSREAIADEFDERYKVRPSGEWADLRDVILETSAVVEKHARQQYETRADRKWLDNKRV